MASGAPPNRDELIATLSGFTGLAPTEAEQYLTASNWDVQAACSLYFDGAPEQQDDAAMAGDDHPQDATPDPPPQQGGARTLGGDFVPSEPSSSSAQPSTARRQPQRGLRTLADLQAQGGHGHAHGEGGDHNSDEDDDADQDFFAGGEKSGLAVQNPNAPDPRSHIENILKRARANVPRPGGDDERPATQFRGTGMTLGGDDAPSRAIPDPNAETPQPAERIRRTLHLWQDGFSVDDGDLYRYDDPANARTLEMINTGHAPLHILNVQPDQEVDVEVHPHKDEKFVKPKKKWVPFGGSGQRLGSPTPGATSSAPPPAPATTSSTTASSASAGAAQPSVNVDSSAPTITLQIRLGDGTRLQSRFNTTHTIGDVYGYVDAASPTSTQREYALMTTFPSKELSDKSQVLGDLSEFKRGGVVVQKWK
ncbi:Cdc48-dependent protein degradation adaptor protein-like protein [Lophiotrema nucula]|uniref:Cdc48-dependent protein degradation adaptor protein-like protein n=1 Tax=Lophiotrema nucula TaxID=690887 RepID=A0A6A5Z2M9_9PLEO|nr:Cdc48-dependent protein degradation adaptor protein-like protein [Lophiotrema nucula]